MNIQFINTALLKSINSTLMISAFVLSIMLLIEYINIQTKAALNTTFKNKPFSQIFTGAILGIIPGCLGTYTAVSLYTHRVIGFAALVTAAIATSGDEAFVMFSMIPKAAIKLHIIIFIIALVSGIIVHYLFRKRMYNKRIEPLPYHAKIPEVCVCFNAKKIIPQLKDMSFTRFILIISTLFFLFLIILSKIGPAEWNWEKWIFLLISVFSLFVFTTVPDHFLEEHLWNHIIKKHLPRIFLWTLVTIFVLAILEKYIDVNNWINNNIWIVMIIAALIGLIPESGPHLIFVALFAKGAIPFSILLTNSIVQDGHGLLPLLAESKRDFLLVKIVNIVIGLLVGSISLIN